MSTAGYNNLKAQGRPLHQTIHQTGSSKTAVNVVLKSVSELTPTPVPIVSVLLSQDAKFLTLEITGHGAKVGNVLRIDSGVGLGSEYDIVEVPNANNIVVHNIITGYLPIAAVTATILFFTTLQTDSEGNLQTSSGPTQFIQNASVVQVVEDSAVPANNRPFPSGLYFNRNGVNVPVAKDTSVPANTIGIPVEIVAASGTPINITAGDLNVQLSHDGANPDSTRIGDGVDLLEINSDGSINVGASALPTGASTSALQTTGNTSLASIVNNTFITKDVGVIDVDTTRVTISLDDPLMFAINANSIIAKDVGVIDVDTTRVTISLDDPLMTSINVNTAIAKGAGVVDANTTRVTISLDDPLMSSVGAQADAAATTDAGSFSIVAFIKRGLQNWTTLLARIPALVSGRMPVDGSGVTQPVSAASLPLPAGAATETTLEALNTKMPTVGQKTMANSTPVVISSDQSPIPVTTTAADLTASGTITTQNLVPAGIATVGSAAAITGLNAHGTIAVQVTGTYTGALSVQGTINGTVWITLNGLININTGAVLATITSALQGIFQVEASGFSAIRITGLAAVTGTASVSLRATRAAGLVGLDNPIPAGANIIGALVANQSVNKALINGVAPLMGNGVTGTGSQRVTIASDNTAIPIAQVSWTGTFQEILNLTNTVQTFTAPANAKWCKVYADDTNVVNIRVKLGGAATASSGIQFQPGRSEDFLVAGNVSVIAETSSPNQRINVTFGV